MERLQKILSNSGLISRRKAEDLIKFGKVEVNGKVAKLGDKADPEKDEIKVEGKKLKKDKKIYLIFNKPSGYLCSLKDEGSKRSIMRLIKVKERVYPIGRLDFDTEGLLLLTNDGDFANRIMHPSFGMSKVYLARLDRNFSRENIKRLKEGIKVDGQITTAKIRYVYEGDMRVLEITIHEGRKHIIKNMMAALGYKVEYLARLKIGPLYIGDLRKGRYRPLNRKELELIEKSSSKHDAKIS